MVTELDARTVAVQYHSIRTGLTAMVLGLLESLGELLHTPVTVTLVRRRGADVGFDEFLVVHG